MFLCVSSNVFKTFKKRNFVSWEAGFYFERFITIVTKETVTVLLLVVVNKIKKD